MRCRIMRIYSALISQTKINTGDLSLVIHNHLRNVIIIGLSRLMTTTVLRTFCISYERSKTFVVLFLLILYTFLTVISNGI